MRLSQPGSRVAVAGLVVANAVPLVGVVALGWDLHSLLVVYWLESGVVGASFLAKILRATGEDDPASLPSMSFNDRPVRAFANAPNVAVARFFVGHYGVFWLVHGVFVLGFPLWFADVPFASPSVVALAAVGLVAYHGVSYRRNFVGRREYERTGPATLMVEPYRRVLVLHLTIVVGAFVVAGVGASVGALAVMVVAKTVLDLRGHWKEHDRARRRPHPTPSTETTEGDPAGPAGRSTQPADSAAELTDAGSEPAEPGG